MSCCHQKIARLDSNVHARGKYHHEAWPLRQGADGYAGVLAVAALLAHMRPQASPWLVPVAPLALLVKFSTLLFHRCPHDTYNCSKLLPWTPQYQTYISPCMAALLPQCALKFFFFLPHIFLSFLSLLQFFLFRIEPLNFCINRSLDFPANHALPFRQLFWNIQTIILKLSSNHLGKGAMGHQLVKG